MRTNWQYWRLAHQRHFLFGLFWHRHLHNRKRGSNSNVLFSSRRGQDPVQTWSQSIHLQCVLLHNAEEWNFNHDKTDKFMNKTTNRLSNCDCTASPIDKSRTNNNSSDTIRSENFLFKFLSRNHWNQISRIREVLLSEKRKESQRDTEERKRKREKKTYIMGLD